MNVFKLMFFLAVGVLLSACGESDEHGHAHDADGGHPQEAAAEDQEHGHEHGDDTHSHDAPETEAMYGDEAESPAEPATTESEPHAHGEDTHTHEESADHHDEAEAGDEHSHDDEPPHDH